MAFDQLLVLTIRIFLSFLCFYSSSISFISLVLSFRSVFLSFRKNTGVSVFLSLCFSYSRAGSQKESGKIDSMRRRFWLLVGRH